MIADHIHVCDILQLGLEVCVLCGGCGESRGWGVLPMDTISQDVG